MRIITWNIYDQNKKISESLDFIFSYSPDIICLQEFPFDKKKEIIFKFKEYSFFFAKDCSLVRREDKRDKLDLLVMGIKKSIMSKVKILPLEIKNNNYFSKRYGYRESVEAIIATIKHSNKSVDILNMHLSLFCGFNMRIKEFNKALSHSNSKNKIICGDFNNFSHYSINWILGKTFDFKRGEYLVDEKKIFKKIFNNQELENPFYKKITAITLKQLDHILFKGFKMKQKKLLYKSLRYSDHIALSIELE